MAWYTTLVRSTDSNAIAQTIRAVLESGGYGIYDPFPGGIGTPAAFKQFVKLFVAPPQNGWVRILGGPDGETLRLLGESYPALHGWLEGTTGGWRLYSAGKAYETPAAFANFLTTGRTVADLERALAGNTPVDLEKPVETLPSDVAQLARDKHVNPKMAQNMMDRMTARLFGKMDRESGGAASEMQDRAHELLNAAAGADWNCLAGRTLRAVAALLDLPLNWREPDWLQVRDAYQAGRMLARNANASLMPAERAALAALPDAANYLAVFVGRP